jgi:hypothetical protein
MHSSPLVKQYLTAVDALCVHNSHSEPDAKLKLYRRLIAQWTHTLNDIEKRNRPGRFSKLEIAEIIDELLDRIQELKQQDYTNGHA